MLLSWPLHEESERISSLIAFQPRSYGGDGRVTVAANSPRPGAKKNWKDPGIRP